MKICQVAQITCSENQKHLTIEIEQAGQAPRQSREEK